MVFLKTFGGNPLSAWRIINLLKNVYTSEVSLVILDKCKSAGVILCLGADKVFLGRNAELDPLDPQLLKSSIFLETTSASDLLNAFNYLRETNLPSNVNIQLDFIQLSKALGAIKEVTDIATRLNSRYNHLQDGALDKLIFGYGDHDFPIFMEEAKDLFNHVYEATPQMAEFLKKHSYLFLNNHEDFILRKLQDSLKEINTETQEEN